MSVQNDQDYDGAFFKMSSLMIFIRNKNATNEKAGPPSKTTTLPAGPALEKNVFLFFF